MKPKDLSHETSTLPPPKVNLAMKDDGCRTSCHHVKTNKMFMPTNQLTN